jgi:hypothetical protein
MPKTPKTMRAILIDARNKTVTEVQIAKGLQPMYDQLKCQTFTVPVILENEDTVYVDDEGLINGTFDFFYAPKVYPTPLAGNALIIGSDSEGESVSAKSNIQDLGEVHFMSRDEVVLFHLNPKHAF